MILIRQVMESYVGNQLFLGHCCLRVLAKSLNTVAAPGIKRLNEELPANDISAILTDFLGQVKGALKSHYGTFKIYIGEWFLCINAICLILWRA